MNEILEQTPVVSAGAAEPLGGRRVGKSLRGQMKEVLFGVYLYCGYVQVRNLLQRLLGRPRVVILYYHRVGHRDVVSKPRDEFRQELEYLSRHYECITLRDLAVRLKAGTGIGRPIAVVTFDDGYLDNFTEAFPELVRARVPATFFVATGYMGTQKVFPHDRRAMEAGKATSADWPKLNWDHLRQMQEQGMEIGSHTVDHTNMGQADEPTVVRELNESLAEIQRQLGERPRAFSFPWGKPCDISQYATESSKKAGYYAAVTTTPGANFKGQDLFGLKRIDVGNGMMSRLCVRARIAGFGSC